VCERIANGVRNVECEAVWPALTVRVSIGTAAAHEGDTAQSLPHRADLAL
jgi:hypothetical protein